MAAIPEDAELDLIVGRHSGNLHPESLHAFERLSVHFGDYVARLQARFGRRAVRNHIRDRYSLGVGWKTKGLRFIRRQFVQ